LRLAGIAIAAADETKHFKLIGTTGTGKSTAIRELLGAAIARGDRAVFADPDGGYMARFFDRYRGDVVLNPFERNSAKWDLFAEIQNSYDVEQLAGGLIPASEDPSASEWRGYARTFLTAVVRRCYLSGRRDIANLWRLLTMASADELRPMIAAGLACAVGYKTRASALVFAATLVFVAVSDRLAAFTVSKLSPAVILGVAAGPAGTRLGLDAWLAARRGAPAPEPLRAMGSVRFLQLLPVTIYSASGIAKARGDWLSTPLVLWSHLHDSYQTRLSFALASILPGWSWTLMQGLVLAFEVLAPLCFAMERTRTYAFVFGLGMHAMIGLCFGPVVWFALLMMTLLVGGWLPEPFFEPLERLAGRLESKSPVREIA